VACAPQLRHVSADGIAGGGISTAPSLAVPSITLSRQYHEGIKHNV